MHFSVFFFGMLVGVDDTSNSGDNNNNKQWRAIRKAARNAQCEKCGEKRNELVSCSSVG